MGYRQEENHRIARKAVEDERKHPTLYQAVLAAADHFKIKVNHSRAAIICAIALRLRNRRNGKA